jgi:hypothetical protein
MPVFDNPSSERSAPKEDHAAALRQTYLDKAVHSVIDPVIGAVASEKSAAGIEAEVNTYTKAFLKTAPLFMKGKLAVGALALTYAADQAKVGDGLSEQATDAVLGLGKAAALKSSLQLMQRGKLSPTLTGIELGIINRTSETALTRENYIGKDGQYSAALGMTSTLKTALNPGHLLVDAATFGAADVLWGRAYIASRGAIRFDIQKNSTIAAGVMGMAGGSGQELVRQYQSNESFDLSAILYRGAAQGTVGALAGKAGGWQSERYQRLSVTDGPGAVHQARTTPFQLGHIGDAKQMALRDGEFTLLSNDVGKLMTPTWKGLVKTPEGNKPVLFRPDDGTQAFAHRMQTEIAAYGLGGKMALSETVPVSVARTVEINGTTHKGYVQEIQGKSLAEVIDPTGSRRLFGKPEKAVLPDFELNTPLLEAYQTAFAKRQIMGEWDNHALNFVASKGAPRGGAAGEIPRDGAAPFVKNIDMGDGLKPATHQQDLIPTPGLRQGWDNLNQHLYRKAAEKPLPAETVSKVKEFVDTYNNPAGRKELGELGMTPAQVEGVLGRAEWFSKHGRLPRGESEPESYRFAAMLYKLMRGRKSSSAPEHRVDD